MRPEEVKQVDRTAIEAWNSHNKEKWTTLCASNVTWEEPNMSETVRGREGVGQLFEGWHRAFPDLHLEVKNRIAGEDSIAVEYTFEGTHKGPLQIDPSQPEIPATGKKVKIQATYFSSLKDGRVLKVRNYPDTVGMMQQLGVDIPTA